MTKNARTNLEKEQIYVTFKNKRSLKKNLFPELLVVRGSLKNQTANNFVSFIFLSKR